MITFLATFVFIGGAILGVQLCTSRSPLGIVVGVAVFAAIIAFFSGGKI